MADRDATGGCSTNPTVTDGNNSTRVAQILATIDYSVWHQNDTPDFQAAKEKNRYIIFY